MTAVRTRIVTFAGTTVAVEYSGQRSTEVIEFVFGCLPPARPTTPVTADLRLTEDPESGVLSLSQGGAVCCVDHSAGAIASWLLHATCRQLIASGPRVDGLLLHAAALAWRGRGLVLPGATGSGKSTLAAFLMHRGFEFLTDELAHVPSGSDRLEGFTVPFKIKQKGVDALEGHVPLTPHSTLVGVHDVLVPPGELGCVAPVPLSAIVFPHHQRDDAFRLEPLSPAQTALRLMTSLVNGSSRPDHGFRECARLAHIATGYTLRYASLRQIDIHLETLRQGTASPEPGPQMGGTDERDSSDE